MKPKKLALSAASLTLVLLFLACSIPGRESSTPMPAASVPTNTDGAEATVLPGGTFWMGSDDAGADENEKPRHEVTLETFPINTHEVTNAMYARCIEAGGCVPIAVLEGAPAPLIEGTENAEDPVVGVDWNMANDYCTWAGARLPTEAEWEYAAGGAKGLTYSWGVEAPDADPVSMTRSESIVGAVPASFSASGTRPAAAGDVWEWTHDWYDQDYYALSPSDSPIGPNLPEDPDDPQKVVRGAGRTGADPQRGFEDVGFRCVAEPALDLPFDYAYSLEGHKFLSPGSGGADRVMQDAGERPSWEVSLTDGYFACPHPDGRVTLIVEARSSIRPITFSATTLGVPFDTCGLHEREEVLECSLIPPPAYNSLSGRVPVQVCFEHALGSGCVDLRPEKRTDCPGVGPTPLEIEASVSCPAHGGVAVTFTYDQPIDWLFARVREGRLYQDMACWSIGETSLECRARAHTPGDTYSFHLYGTDADGWPHYERPTADMPSDCGSRGRTVQLIEACVGAGPAVILRLDPTRPLPISVSSPGVPHMTCINSSPGVLWCQYLLGEAGSTTTVTTCFAGEDCQGWPVTVARCAREPTVGEVRPICDFGYPAAQVTYAPATVDPPSVDAVGGTFAVCHAPAPGVLTCLPLPDDVGTTATVQTCYPGEPCETWRLFVPDCEEEVPSVGKFALAGVGCHDEKQVYFILDTRLPWLVPGAAFTYTAADGETAYSCSVHPTIAGRLYCSGSRPGSPGPLQVCVQQEGSPSPTCHSFADWPAQEDSIPDCAGERTSPGLPPCSSYTNPNLCPLDRCQLQLGHCVPK